MKMLHADNAGAARLLEIANPSPGFRGTEAGLVKELLLPYNDCDIILTNISSLASVNAFAAALCRVAYMLLLDILC